MADRVIQIRFEQKGAQEVKKHVQDLDHSIEKTGKNVKHVSDNGSKAYKKLGASIDSATSRMKHTESMTSKLRNSFAGLAGAFGAATIIRSVAGIANEFQDLDNKLRVVSKSMGEVREFSNKLFDIAQRSRTAYGDMVNLFVSAKIPLEEMGYSTEKVLHFTELIGKAATVSGASTEAISRSLTQMNQAVGAGIFRAEEFNSILDSTPYILQMVAKGLGISLIELRKWVLEGRLTTDLYIQGITKAEKEINETLSNMQLTWGQALGKMRNAYGNYVHGLNQSTGVMKTLSATVGYLADNFEVLANVVGGTLTVVALPALFRWTSSILGLFAAMHPVLRAITIFATLTNGILALSSSIKLTSDGSVTLADALSYLGDRAASTASKMLEVFKPVKDAMNDARKVYASKGVDMDYLELPSHRLEMSHFQSVPNTKALDKLIKIQKREKSGYEKFLENVSKHKNTKIKAVEEALEVTRITDEERGILSGKNIINTLDTIKTSVTDVGSEFTKTRRGMKNFSSEISRTNSNLRPTVDMFNGIHYSADNLGSQLNNTGVDVLNFSKGFGAINNNKQPTVDTLDSINSSVSGMGDSTVNAFDSIKSSASVMNTEFDGSQTLMSSFADGMDKWVTNSVNRAADAITTFVTTGKLNFTELVDSILEDLIRLQAKKGLEKLSDTATDAISNALFGKKDSNGEGAVKDSLIDAGVKGLTNTLFGGDKNTDRVPGSDTVPEGYRRSYKMINGERVTVLSKNAFWESLGGIGRTFTNTMGEALTGFSGGGYRSGGDSKASVFNYVGTDLSKEEYKPPPYGHSHRSQATVTKYRGFARGGSFMVGGIGGIDSQTVAFRASPNERVTVETPEQARVDRDQRPVINIVNIVDPDEAIGAMGSYAGEEVILNTIRNNSSAIRSMLG